MFDLIKCFVKLFCILTFIWILLGLQKLAMIYSVLTEQTDPLRVDCYVNTIFLFYSNRFGDIFLKVEHEPENDSGWQSSDWLHHNYHTLFLHNLNRSHQVCRTRLCTIARDLCQQKLLQIFWSKVISRRAHVLNGRFYTLNSST